MNRDLATAVISSTILTSLKGNGKKLRPVYNYNAIVGVFYSVYSSRMSRRDLPATLRALAKALGPLCSRTAVTSVRDGEDSKSFSPTSGQPESSDRKPSTRRCTSDGRKPPGIPNS